VLQRLLWFGRRDFAEDPIRGLTNVDNDSWPGSYLFNKLVEMDALQHKVDGTWSLDFAKVVPTFAAITQDIDALAATVVATAKP
jgi:hypothetical protein